MTITVKKIAMPEQHPTHIDTKGITENTLSLVGGVEINCLVRLGTLTMTIGELQSLKQGQILSLEQKTHEPVDILVNHQVIARGKLMSCEDQYAIQITEVHS